MGSTLKLCIFLLLFAAGLIFVLEYFRVEERFLGFSYTAWAWNQTKGVLEAIHHMMDSMMTSLKKSAPH
jgi:hypothetical protein